MIGMFDNELRCQICHKKATKLKRFCGNNWLCNDCYEEVTNDEIESIRPVHTRRFDGRRCKD